MLYTLYRFNVVLQTEEPEVVVIDSHCHLDPLFYKTADDIDAVIQNARKAGVSACITIGAGTGIHGAKHAIALAEQYKDIHCTVGIHPLEASIEKAFLDEMYVLFHSEKVVGAGEMGLDFFRNTISPSIQEQCFITQIGWAKKLGLPVVIHDRESHGRVLELLVSQDAFSTVSVLYHCFTSDVLHMEEIVEKGGYISIPGIVTFKKSKMMKSVAKSVPLDRLLIETDSPFLTPKPHRGQRNEPKFIVHTAQYIAELRGMERDELVAHTDRNTYAVFSRM